MAPALEELSFLQRANAELKDRVGAASAEDGAAADSQGLTPISQPLLILSLKPPAVVKQPEPARRRCVGLPAQPCATTSLSTPLFPLPLHAHQRPNAHISQHIFQQQRA